MFSAKQLDCLFFIALNINFYRFFMQMQEVVLKRHSAKKCEAIFYLQAGTAHQFKSRGAEMGLSEKSLKPRPLERRKRLLLENTFLFLLDFYKQSGSENSLRVTKHQANQARKYITSLNKLKLLMNKNKNIKNRQKRFPVKKDCYSSITHGMHL